MAIFNSYVSLPEGNCLPTMVSFASYKREHPENWELTTQAYELVNPGTCRFRKIVTASDNQVTLVIP
jgi:hypothetical protein